jgi:phospholipid/cholesterol/gamma-HCH transport system substrate-binding protein
MPRKKQIKLAELKVGIFILIALLMLSALILRQSWDLNWFKESVLVITYLPDVGGLKSGAPVWLAGIEIGRVRKVRIISPEIYSGNAPIFHKIEELKKKIEVIRAKPASSLKEIDDLQDQIRDLKMDIRLVEVLLDIHPQYLDRISKDSEVSIESKGLIGDSFIDISPGTYGERPLKRGEYYFIESIQHPGFREIMTGANDVVANFGVLSDNIKTIIKKINPDKVGSGIAEILQETQKTILQINQTFNRTSALLDEVQKGRGTVGKLMTDPELYNRLVVSMGKINSLAESIQNGNGTLGKLINDPSLYNSTTETMKKAEALMSRIEKGEGTLGKLSKDEALYERSKVALEQFATLAAEIEQGKGTVGKLLKDPSLYNNLDQSSSEISKLLYDIRKDPKKFLSVRVRVF